MTDLLLIHGAWQGAWVWDALTPLLTAAGYTVEAPDLPDRATLEDYVAFLSARLSRPAIVIGHSGGGVVRVALAEARDGRCSRLGVPRRDHAAIRRRI